MFVLWVEINNRALEGRSKVTIDQMQVRRGRTSFMANTQRTLKLIGESETASGDTGKVKV